MADPHVRAERFGARTGGRRPPATNRTSSSGNVVVSRSSRRAERDRVRARVDARDVARLAERDAEALPLPDGVARPRRRAPPPARRRRRSPAPPRVPSRPANGARRGTSPSGMKQMPWLSGLSAVARPSRGRRRGPRAWSARRAGTARGRAAPGGGRTGSTSGPCRHRGRAGARARPSRALAPAGVVAGRDRVALVQVARPPSSAPNLTLVLQSVHGRRRLAVEVGAEERREHARLELALEVHHVERDAELPGDPARVVGGVQRAAALLELRDVSATSWRRIQTPTTSWPCSVQQRRRDRRIDAARHRDERSRGSGTLRPRRPPGRAGRRRGRAAAARDRRGSAARPRPPSSTSASVVVRPSESRSEPRASSSG